MRRVNLTLNLIGGIYQSGALFSLSPPDRANNTLNIRVGVSFRSVEQACANAEEEVGSASFEEIRDRARLLWLDKLKRVEIDLANTSKNVTQMLYSSMYRSFLTPVSFPANFCTNISHSLSRTMPVGRVKRNSEIPHTHISTPCIAAGTL